MCRSRILDGTSPFGCIYVFFWRNSGSVMHFDQVDFGVVKKKCVT